MDDLEAQQINAIEFDKVFHELRALLKASKNVSVIQDRSGLFGIVINGNYALDCYSDIYAFSDKQRALYLYELHNRGSGAGVISLNLMYSDTYGFATQISLINHMHLFDEAVQQHMLYNMNLFNFKE
jgi:hypothetical protein